MLYLNLLESCWSRWVAKRVLPNFLCGSRVFSDTTQQIAFPNGMILEIVVADRKILQVWSEAENFLVDLKIDEITAFLYTAGQNWKRRDYPLRQTYEHNLRLFRGYSEKAAQMEADWIALFLCSTFRLYDMLSVEFGSWQILDEWVPKEEALVKAFPVGKVLHLAPGNVPISTVVSVLRALVTKNMSLVKCSSSDPFTATALAQSFIEIDEQHPVAQSVGVTYWPTQEANSIGSEFAARADAIIAWGGEDAVRWATQYSSPEAEVLRFGPKRSVAIIGSLDEYARCAEAIALDCSLYDQGACFSTRQVFVKREELEFLLPELRRQLSKVETLVPPSMPNVDTRAIRALNRAHADLFGLHVSGSQSDSWDIILSADGTVAQHPLGRTVYITPFDAIEEVLPHISSEVQTVSVFPWAFGQGVRDRLARRKVSRIVECGMANIFRVGGTHDGMYPLSRLVRLVSNELPGSQRAKGINIPINQMEFIEYDLLLDFV